MRILTKMDGEEIRIFGQNIYRCSLVLMTLTKLYVWKNLIFLFCFVLFPLPLCKDYKDYKMFFLPHPVIWYMGVPPGENLCPCHLKLCLCVLGGNFPIVTCSMCRGEGYLFDTNFPTCTLFVVLCLCRVGQLGIRKSIRVYPPPMSPGNNLL